MMARASAAGTRVTGCLANVSALVTQIVGVVQRLNVERSLVFRIDVPTDIEVNCDPSDLAEMLSNLIDNACKWCVRTIAIGASATDECVIISIVDDGPGISPDQRASVFEIGTRLDETKAGRGLGLAISRDLAALYGGTVELDDAPGGGLRATLKLEFSEGE